MVVKLLYQQSEIFPDRNHGGRTFYNEAVMSAMKIPQVIKDLCKKLLLKNKYSFPVNYIFVLLLCFCVMLNVSSNVIT